MTTSHEACGPGNYCSFHCPVLEANILHGEAEARALREAEARRRELANNPLVRSLLARSVANDAEAAASEKALPRSWVDGRGNVIIALPATGGRMHRMSPSDARAVAKQLRVMATEADRIEAEKARAAEGLR